MLLFLMFAIYFRLLTTFWPLTSAVQAWKVGLLWLVLTLAFEFGFGHFIAGRPWSSLFFDYNVLAGRLWVFIPLWVLTAPVLFFYRDVGRDTWSQHS